MSWTEAEVETLRDINEKFKREGINAIDTDESALVKQAFHNFDPERDEELYVSLVANFPTELSEVHDELKRGLA